jgi:hypothetical protein
MTNSVYYYEQQFNKAFARFKEVSNERVIGQSGDVVLIDNKNYYVAVSVLDHYINNMSSEDKTAASRIKLMASALAAGGQELNTLYNTDKRTHDCFMRAQEQALLIAQERSVSTHQNPYQSQALSF